MRNDRYMDFGEEISRTVKKVLNSQDFNDLKHSINQTVRDFSGGKCSAPFDDGMPPLSEEGRSDREAEWKEDADDYWESQQEAFNWKTLGEAVENGETISSFEASAPGARNSSRGQSERTHPRASSRRKKEGSLIGSTLFLVFGLIGAIPSGLLLLIGTLIGAFIFGTKVAVTVASGFGLLFLVSLVLIFVGLHWRKKVKRFRFYNKVLDGRSFCMVKELSEASGKEQKYIIKDLRCMIKTGMFVEGYLDKKETCFMTDYWTYNQYLEAEESAEKRRKAEEQEREKWNNIEGGAALKQTIDEGKKYIQGIKEVNNDLPEQEISDRLNQLEDITTKIFNYVEQNPEKLPQIRKFMCYYMPITMKMVKAYQQFVQHETTTSEVEATKLEIRGTLSTINKAYENLFEKLIQEEILDVSSDISALETILSQEGLTE